MRNVTITVEEDVYRWARIQAAKKDTSLARLLGDMLRQEMEREDAYWKAYEEWKQIKPWPIGKGKPYPKREEIYTRGLGKRRVRR